VAGSLMAVNRGLGERKAAEGMAPPLGAKEAN